MTRGFNAITLGNLGVHLFMCVGVECLFVFARPHANTDTRTYTHTHTHTHTHTEREREREREMTLRLKPKNHYSKALKLNSA